MRYRTSSQAVAAVSDRTMNKSEPRSLQELRDSFDLDEEVHVRVRGYAGHEPRLRLGKIVDKEQSFAVVKFFDRGMGKFAYSRLQRVGAGRMLAEVEAPPPVVNNDNQSSQPVLRAVPTAFSQARLVPTAPVTPAPAARAAYIKTSLPETEEPEPKHDAPAKAPEPSPAPPAVPKDPPPGALPPAPPVTLPTNPDTTSSASAPTSDMDVWLDMGRSLLPSLQATMKRLHKESEELAAQADALMEQSDAKVKEADTIKKHIDILERLHSC